MINSKPTKPLQNRHPEHRQRTLEQLLASDCAILDVRAETEYEQGALPNSINIPILNDDERARVGTTYKQQGSQAAQKVGHRLVSGEVRETRIRAWVDFLSKHEQSRLICWRGGLRSQLAQSWLNESGIDVERVAGGYKALRRTCMSILAERAEQKHWCVLAGQTGTAKTVVINHLRNTIDLEGIAHHRGSAFGAHSTVQPSPATFENRLAYEFLRLQSDHLLVEDESRTIGRLALPETWHQQMQNAPLVLLEAEHEFRINHIRAEYIDSPIQQGESAAELETRYCGALDRIAKRLGGVNHGEIKALLQEAFAGKRAHNDWIDALLIRYYDPMYDFQLKKKAPRIVVRGNHQTITEYLSDHGHGVAQPMPHLLSRSPG